MLHAHFETQTSDCDGAISRDWVVQMNEEELAGREEENYFGEIHFHDRIVTDVVNTYSLLSTGTLTVTRLDDDDVRMTWNEGTEEGHRYVEVTLCNDDCNLEEHHYQDHRAEAAGY